MTSPKGHLTVEEIEYILAREGNASPEDAASRVPSDDEAVRHAQGCERCLTALDRVRRGQRALEELAEDISIADSEGCPNSLDWARLTGDSASEEEHAGLLEHVAGCTRCALVLATYPSSGTREGLDLNEASTAPRAGEIASLARAMAVAYGADARASGGSKWLGWVAAAAVLALAVGALFVSLRDRTGAVNSRLRVAYSERRTIELRYPGAAFAPLAVTRGGDIDVDDAATASLLDARTVILQGLSSSPGSEDWLHARARADLLLWRYADAIETLEQLTNTRPDSPALLMDLATGLFERAEIQQRATDYRDALALLNRVLESDSDNLTALYNRAILLEKLSRFTEAVEAWDAYLALDASSEWAQEAAERRRGVRQRAESVGWMLQRAVGAQHARPFRCVIGDVSESSG